MFDLIFIDEEPRRQEEGWQALEGQIILGDCVESFLAPIAPWTRENYQRHWIEAAERLVKGADRTAFVTAAFQFWWPMWRDGDEVVAQEQLLWAERLADVFDPGNVFAAIPERERFSESGQRISEWRVDLDDLQDFVDRRGATYR